MFKVGDQFRDMIDNSHIRIKEVINDNEYKIVVNGMYLEDADNNYLEKYCKEITIKE